MSKQGPAGEGAAEGKLQETGSGRQWEKTTIPAVPLVGKRFSRGNRGEGRGERRSVFTTLFSKRVGGMIKGGGGGRRKFDDLYGQGSLAR